MSWIASGFVKGLTVSGTGNQITRGEKLVLLIIADYHNAETGYANPSINRLAEEGLYERRQVIRIVESLEEKGFIQIIKASNENNKYLIVGLVTKCHPLPGSTVTKGQSASDKASDISPFKMSPEPIRTNKPIKQTNTNGSLFSDNSKKETIDISKHPWLPKKEWEEWLEHRREKKKPASLGAQRQAIEKLSKLKSQGEDPAEILKEAILRNWTGIFSILPSWSKPKPKKAVEETEDAFQREQRLERERKARK